MKAFIIENKKEYNQKNGGVSTSYELKIATTIEEIIYYRQIEAYEVPKIQTVNTFGFYLPFANSKNTKITKTEKGFDLDFKIKKEVQNYTKNIKAWLWLYVKRILIAFDQLANTLIHGYEDESLSSRFYRWSLKTGKLWKIPAIIVDTLLFFDKGKDLDGTIIHHCEKAFQNELKRTGLPHIMR